MRRRGIVSMLALLSLLSQQGCEASRIILTSPTGVSYTLDGIIYKIFNTPLESLHGATLKSLQRMGIEVKGTRATESGKKIVAVASGGAGSAEREGIPHAD